MFVIDGLGAAAGPNTVSPAERRRPFEQRMTMNTEERLAALEAKMQELVDRQAIFDCIKRNSRGNDRFDAELTAAAITLTGFTKSARTGCRAGLRRACQPGPRQAVRRQPAQRDDAHVRDRRRRCPCRELQPGHVPRQRRRDRPHPGRRYIDRLEKRDGEWRIVLRRSTVEIALERQGDTAHGRFAARVQATSGAIVIAAIRPMSAR